MSIVAAECSGQEITLRRKTGANSQIVVKPEPALSTFLANIGARLRTYNGESFTLMWAWEDRFFVLGLRQSPTSVSVEKLDVSVSWEILKCLCQISGAPLLETERRINEQVDLRRGRK